MDIIEEENGIFMTVLEALLEVAEGCFASMIAIDKGQVELLELLQRGPEGVLKRAYSKLDMIAFQVFKIVLCYGGDIGAAFEADDFTFAAGALSEVEGR